jgi:hypothetical protein
MTENNPQQYLNPYDLQAPARLIYPGFKYGTKNRVTKLELGTVADRVELTRIRYEGGETRWELKVPCDNIPHCSACECSSSHYVSITPEQVQQLKQFLGL